MPAGAPSSLVTASAEAKPSMSSASSSTLAAQSFPDSSSSSSSISSGGDVMNPARLEQRSDGAEKRPAFLSQQQQNHKRPVTFARIRWAPLTIPRERRLQTATVAVFGTLMATTLACFLWLCSFSRLWPFLIAYLTWVYFIDDAPRTGKRTSQRMRRSAFWRHFADYFPISLVKTVNLPPDRKYVFGSHPHGIISVGAIANFASDATGFSTLFPGLKPNLMTLTSNFKIPLYREILLSMGICSVSKRSCQTILRQGAGSCITIVVGGAAESLSATPGTADLTLKRRLGFIKLAVREGADLVPVFSFGENDIFEQLAGRKDSKLRSLQKRFQHTFGFTLRTLLSSTLSPSSPTPVDAKSYAAIFFGRGVFNYSAGLMPFRRPIVSVVGRPIRTTQDPHPSTETLEKYQAQYINELMRIWEEHKDVLAPNRKKDLSIIE